MKFKVAAIIISLCALLSSCSVGSAEKSPSESTNNAASSEEYNKTISSLKEENRLLADKLDARDESRGDGAKAGDENRQLARGLGGGLCVRCVALSHLRFPLSFSGCYGRTKKREGMNPLPQGWFELRPKIFAAPQRLK